MAIDLDDDRLPLIGCAVVVGLLALGICFARSDDGWFPILDGANLVFHEAGHKFYGLLGSTFELYGGSLGQLTFPVAAAAIFGYRKQWGSSAICIAWAGQNMFNIARYMADARAMELPLVGGTEHDWYNIFMRWHCLSKDEKIAAHTCTLGWALIIAAMIMIAIELRRLHTKRYLNQ
jgi:hypothetical protein